VNFSWRFGEKMPEVQQTAGTEIDPLFSMEEETPEEEEEVKSPEEEEAVELAKERLLYRELVLGDPFHREASPSIKKMLSFSAWKAVSERTPEPDLGDVCFGQVVQKVDIIPGKLVPHYRMITAKEWRYIIGKMVDIIPAQIPNQQAIYRLAFGLYSLDNIPIWSSGLSKPNGEIDDAKVTTMVRRLEDRPLDVLHLLSTHYEWFRARMHILLEGGQIKNG
jgi:hypothetical protein